MKKTIVYIVLISLLLIGCSTQAIIYKNLTIHPTANERSDCFATCVRTDCSSWDNFSVEYNCNTTEIEKMKSVLEEYNG